MKNATERTPERFISLREWLAENDLHLDTPVAVEVMDSAGECYRREWAWFWVCPLLIVQTDPTGTRVVAEDDEQELRDSFNAEGAA